MSPERCLLALLLTLLGAVAAQAKPATGEFEGIVLDRQTEQPVGGVRVTLEDLGRTTTTDAEGWFGFAGAPAGPHRLGLSGPALSAVTIDESVTAGALRTVRYLVSRARQRSYVSTVRAPRVERQSVVEVGLDRAQAARVAGTADDPLKVVEDLPGVARSTAGTGQLIVWGAAPTDSRIVVDGVELPALYHLGGWRSVLNGELVGRVSLAPGGFGPAYGRALGGLVQVETAEPPPAGLHGYVAADLLDASALLSLSRGRVSVIAAGRYSWLDRLAGAVVSQKSRALVPVPRYDDYQLAASLRLRPRESLSLLFLAADDALRRTLDADDPSAVRSDAIDRSSYRLLLRYQMESDGAAITVTPYFGYDTDQSAARYGPLPARLGVVTLTGGLRGLWRRRLGRHVVLGVGLDLLDRHSRVERLGSLTIPPREGDRFVFGQPPGEEVASADDRFHQLDAAPFASLEVQLGPLRLTPGVRLDALLTEGDHVVPPVAGAPVAGFSRLDWRVDPRLSMRWAVQPRLWLQAAVGLYHQPPAPTDLGARFGNPTLGPMSALHALLGGTLRLRRGLTIELTGYYRQLDELVSRSQSPSPPIGAALVQEGRGRAYGGQLRVELAPWRGLSGFASYTVGRSEIADHPDADWRLSDYDQTHLFTLVGNYARAGWDFGLRFRFASGFPRTPVVGAYFDARDDRYDPLFGAHNSIRIPYFAALDLRVERLLIWQPVSLRLYLDVQNVTYRQNPEEIVYRADYSQRGYITGLPTLAVLGARVSF